jgi:hypothetical protein
MTDVIMGWLVRQLRLKGQPPFEGTVSSPLAPEPDIGNAGVTGHKWRLNQLLPACIHGDAHHMSMASPVAVHDLDDGPCKMRQRTAFWFLPSAPTAQDHASRIQVSISAQDRRFARLVVI